MSQSFDLTGPSVTTHVQFNGADCEKVMLNGTRIWERYITTQQVWVSSGYNTTSWVFMWNKYSRNSPYYYASRKSSGYSIWRDYDYSSSVRIYNQSGNPTTVYFGGYKYVKGAYRYKTSKNTKFYELNKYQEVTTWVDTSSYQTQNVTAYYY